ncbi:MAG: aminoacyl-histidine dipeptidase [Ruminococcaceae bacterium]|nr:aminoacyl-histidine dipeptidase [Oscillospiraceae bacterium]
MNIFEKLEPRKVFEYFSLLSSVPHGSGNTKFISDICQSFAEELGLTCLRDSLNNVIIFKKASPGYEDCEPVILQGHLDMVCAKDEDCKIDMEKEGLDLRCDGQWIWAEGTSLGGDNAIAVAVIMAILADNGLPHPPIEAVFTVDEETGMDGAKGLDTSCLKGRRLINLDSEEEGIFTAGCAGGARVNCSLPVRCENAGDARFFSVTIDGLLGGHSGVEIDKCRASANRLMGRMLFDIGEQIELRLCSLEGGTLDNVIPKNAVATVAVAKEDCEKFIGLTEKYDAIYKNEFATSDSGICVKAEPAEHCDAAVTAADTKRLLSCLIMLPYHVQEMSADIKGLVQTSLNMGVLKLYSDRLTFSFAVRSSVTSQKEELIRRVRATVEFCGGEVSVHGDYPAWQYAKVSPLRDTVLDSYKRLTGNEGKVVAIHAGLECGLFIEKLPGLDCISFGPDLRDVHSTRERLSVSSTARMYDLVCEILRSMK